MESENLKVYYRLSQFGRYYLIEKIGVIKIPDGEIEPEGDQTATREGEFLNTGTEVGVSKGQIMSQYLYPVTHSYVQSIVYEITENEETFYVFGLLLINSLSRGTFVFSAQGLERGEYQDQMGNILDYQMLLQFFAFGDRAVFPGDGIKYPYDETQTAQ